VVVVLVVVVLLTVLLVLILLVLVILLLAVVVEAVHLMLETVDLAVVQHQIMHEELEMLGHIRHQKEIMVALIAVLAELLMVQVAAVEQEWLGHLIVEETVVLVAMA
jgi:hypothetical protein